MGHPADLANAVAHSTVLLASAPAVLAVLMYWFFKLDINLPFAWFKLDKSCLCEYVERCFGYPYGGAVKKLT
ncbi:hypothetical protein D3C79_1049070 [compost metagenome]